MSTTQRPPARFHVGDWVSFVFGAHRVWAQITEDRGPIGVNRRRLYRVEFGDEPNEVIALEMPEGELDSVKVDQQKIVEYLKGGGLVNILRSNLSGGEDQPRVWLAFNSLGNLNHTFIEERGIIGGRTVPFFALHEDRIFKPKEEEVIEFLSSFGLSRAEADDVILTVGTYP